MNVLCECRGCMREQEQKGRKIPEVPVKGIDCGVSAGGLIINYSR